MGPKSEPNSGPKRGPKSGPRWGPKMGPKWDQKGTKECFPGFHFSPDFAQDSEGGIGLALGAGGGQKANPLRENKITKN